MINYNNHFETWWSLLKDSPCINILENIIEELKVEYDKI